jgi:hypothetical protein
LNYGFNQKRSEKKENRREMSDIRANTFSPFNAVCAVDASDNVRLGKCERGKVDGQHEDDNGIST